MIKQLRAATTCKLGRHDRRRVSWVDEGYVRTPSGDVLYSQRMHGYLCRWCEPIPCADAISIRVEGKPETWPTA